MPEFTAEKLTIGDTGAMVDAVQKTLASLGYLSQDKLSGQYDNATKKAVIQFQKANYLEATGVVDKATYSLIFDANATAPTTRTTDLPSTTGTETSATESPSQTVTSAEESTTASASAEETKPTAASLTETSQSESTTASSLVQSETETTEKTKQTTVVTDAPSSDDTTADGPESADESKPADPVG